MERECVRLLKSARWKRTRTTRFPILLAPKGGHQGVNKRCPILNKESRFCWESVLPSGLPLISFLSGMRTQVGLQEGLSSGDQEVKGQYSKGERVNCRSCERVDFDRLCRCSQCYRRAAFQRSLSAVPADIATPWFFTQ